MSYAFESNFIKIDDVFKLLSYRVEPEFRYMDKEERAKVSFYRESVTLLRNIEQLLSDVKEGGAPTEEEYEKALESKNKKESEKIQRYFSKLRYHKIMVEAPLLKLGKNFYIVKNNYKSKTIHNKIHWDTISLNIDPSLQTDAKQDFYDNLALELAGDHQPPYYWESTNFQSEACFKLLYKLRVHLERWNRELKIQEQNIKKYVQSKHQDFDELLQRYSSVFTLALDIRFINDYETRSHEKFGRFLQKILEQRNAIHLDLQQLPFLLQMHSKLEHDFQLGINMHCIFIFQNDSSLKEDEIIAGLESILPRHFKWRLKIDIRNRNILIRSRCSKLAVGVIRETKPIQVQKFKYWILSYFYMVDDYIKLEYADESKGLLDINYFWSKPWQTVPVAALSKPNMLFDQIVTERDEHSIWTTRHLLPDSIKRIKLAQLHYEALLSGHPEASQLIDVLTHIEIFIETLVYGTALLFNLPAFQGPTVPTERQLVASVTRSAKQLISLGKHLHLLAGLLNSPTLLRHVSIQANTLLFSQLLESVYRVSGQPISGTEMVSMNYLASAYRDGFNKKIKDHDYKSLWFGHRSQEEISLSCYLESKYGKCEGREAPTEKYVRHFFKKDSWLCRIKISCFQHDFRMRQADFSRLLTDFIRVAKRSKPLSWMRGYLLVWQEDENTNPYADVVLILDGSRYGQHAQFSDLLLAYWQNYLAPKAEAKAQAEKNANTPVKVWGSITLIPILKSVAELNQLHLLVESIDKPRQKNILSHLIPHFIYREIFQVEPIDSIAKVFTKGKNPYQERQTRKNKKKPEEKTSESDLLHNPATEANGQDLLIEGKKLARSEEAAGSFTEASEANKKIRSHKEAILEGISNPKRT